jgi:glycerophosphoryl diester phosphodiesterase
MGQYPENTLRALGLSAPHVDMIEVDVQRCGTGELVVFHDERVDRITGEAGRVRQTSFENLRELTVHDSGERIPTLAEAFEVIPDDVGVNIELKSERIAEDTHAVTKRFDNDVVVSSFSATAIRRATDAGFDATALLFASDPDGNLDRADRPGCSYVHPKLDLCLDSDLIERAHGQGLAVNVWTVGTHDPVPALVDAGVDGLILDRWDIIS